MAYGFGATLGTGTTDRIDLPSIAQPTLSTFSIWAYRNGAGGANFGTMMQVNLGNATFLRNNEGGSNNQFGASWTGGPANWTFAGRPSTGVWAHYLITYDGGSTSNNPVCYVNGVSQSVTPGNTPSGSLTTTAAAVGLGNRISDAATVWDGALAEFGRWNRLLAAGEIAALAGGYSPLFFARGLLEYRPLIRGLGSPMFAVATANGTPLVQPHPRVIFPSEFRVLKSTSVLPSLAQIGRPPWRGAWRGALRGTQ